MPSKIHKRGRTRWMGRVQKDGQIKQKLFETKSQALAWEAEQRDADWTTPTGSCALLEWASKYLDHVRVRHAEKTYQEKRGAFARLLKAFPPEMRATSLQAVHFLRHLQSQAQQRSGYAANKDRKNLATAWGWGVKYLGLTMPNPVAQVERFGEERQPRYVPPEEHFWQIYELAQGQDRVMLATYLYLAARRGEIFRLTWADVDFGRKRVRLATRKRRDGTLEHDWLPMAEDLAQQLRWWWENRTFKDAVHVFLCEDDTPFCQEYYGQPFSQRRHFMARLCRRAGVRPFGFHAIRHLTATILYGKGYPESVIQAILRHRSPHTTARYLKSLGLEEARPALDSLGRRPAKVIELKRSQEGGE
jgi:integrase